MDPIIVVAVALGLVILILAILAYALAQAAGKEPPMPSEQPREGTQVERCVTCGSPVEVVTSDEGTSCYRPAQPQPMGEGDDLAARLDGDRLQEWFTEIQASASLLPEDLEIIEAMIARASTHPEQSARVEAIEKALLWYADPDHWLDGQAGEWIVEEGNHVSGDGFAHNEFEHDNGERARAALEPASSTPTEQENDR